MRTTLFQITSLVSMHLLCRDEDIEALVRLPLLKHLSVTVCSKESLLSDAFNQLIACLNSLRLAVANRCMLPDFRDKMDNLQSLHLENFIVEDEEAMYGLTSLTELSVKNVDLSSDTGLNFLSSMPCLKQVVLDLPWDICRLDCADHPLNHQSLLQLTSPKIMVKQNTTAWISLIIGLFRLETLALIFDVHMSMNHGSLSDSARLTNLRNLEIRNCTAPNPLDWSLHREFWEQLESLKLVSDRPVLNIQVFLRTLKASVPHLKIDLQERLL